MADDTQEVLYAVIHSRGPAWDVDKPMSEQPDLGVHVAYLTAHASAIVMSGPFLDESGGMSLFRFESLEAARAMAEADPGVTGGMLSVTVRPWMIAVRG